MLLTSASNESMVEKQLRFGEKQRRIVNAMERQEKNHHVADPLCTSNHSNTSQTPLKHAASPSSNGNVLEDDNSSKPFFIMDFLEQIDPAAIELAQKILKTPQKQIRVSQEATSDTTACKNQIAKDWFSSSPVAVRKTPNNGTSKFFQRSIAIGNGYNAKGIQKARQGAWGDALACWESAFEIRVQILGASHIDTANCCNNIGIAYGKLNCCDRAVAFLERALAIRREHYGSEHHPEVAATLHNLGNVYQQQGDFEAAIEYFGRCKSLQEAMLGGSDHIEIARACIAIGHTYYQAEALEDARAAYMDALYIFHRVGLDENDAEVQAAFKDVRDLDQKIHPFAKHE